MINVFNLLIIVRGQPIVQLQGAPVEQAVYKMLDKRISVHTKMIDLYKEILD